MRARDRTLMKITSLALVSFGLVAALMGLRAGWWWLGLAFAAIGVLGVTFAKLAGDVVGPGLRSAQVSRSGPRLRPGASHRINVASYCAIGLEALATAAFFVAAFDSSDASAEPVFRSFFLPMSLIDVHPAGGEDFLILAALNVAIFTAAYVALVEVPLALWKRA